MRNQADKAHKYSVETSEEIQKPLYNDILLFLSKQIDERSEDSLAAARLVDTPREGETNGNKVVNARPRMTSMRSDDSKFSHAAQKSANIIVSNNDYRGEECLEDGNAYDVREKFSRIVSGYEPKIPEYNQKIGKTNYVTATRTSENSTTERNNNFSENMRDEFSWRDTKYDSQEYIHLDKYHDNSRRVPMHTSNSLLMQRNKSTHQKAQSSRDLKKWPKSPDLNSENIPKHTSKFDLVEDDYFDPTKREILKEKLPNNNQYSDEEFDLPDVYIANSAFNRKPKEHSKAFNENFQPSVPERTQGEFDFEYQRPRFTVIQNVKCVANGFPEKQIIKLYQ